MPLSDAQLAQRLIRAGFLPSLVETALQVAAAVDQAEPTEIDVAQDSVVTETDLALAQVFWWYTPDVPPTYKRLLTARNRQTSQTGA